MHETAHTDAMTFLNDISSIHASAISFAAGRPADCLSVNMSPAVLMNALETFAERVPMHKILQYGQTAGLINDLVAEQTRIDHGVRCNPEQLVITAGCQEALALSIATICPSPGDVLLVRNPTYTGATGAAAASGVEIFPLEGGKDASICEQIDKATNRLRQQGKRAKAIYLIPDFDNPTGSVMSLRDRQEVLDMCVNRGIVVIEDSAYRQFRYEGETTPTMSAMGGPGCVIYLTTYAKSLTPSLRVGAAILPETLFGSRQAAVRLKEDFIRRKSYVTVNTSQVSQAIVGGLLMQNDLSLSRLLKPAVKFYRKNLTETLLALESELGSHGPYRWNKPTGGFFLSLKLPFRFGSQEVEECARSAEVIVMPMSYFSIGDSYNDVIRLAISSVSPDAIGPAITRLATFLKATAQRTERAHDPQPYS